MYKFEKLEIWVLALEYVDTCYEIANLLPDRERFNLTQQLCRATVSVSLNIAEGSIGQSDREQTQFLKIANRSLIETVACLHLIHRRSYLESRDPLRDAYRMSHKLSAKIQAMRRAIGDPQAVREIPSEYEVAEICPF